MIKRLGYTIAEFSEISGLGRTTIFLEIKAGRLPAKRLRSRKTLILHDEGEEYLKNLPDARGGDDGDDDENPKT